MQVKYVETRKRRGHTSLELRVSDMERKSLLSGILSFELDSFIELPNAKRRGGLNSEGRDGVQIISRWANCSDESRTKVIALT